MNSAYQITAGPDGALWFTNFGSNSIGRITTGLAVTTSWLPNATVGDPYSRTLAAPAGSLLTPGGWPHDLEGRPKDSSSTSEPASLGYTD